MKPATSKGVTIIELIMVIIIVGILAGVSSLYIKQVIDQWRFLSFRNEAVSQVKAALFRMTREIRQIQDSASVFVADASRLQFTDINNQIINYQLSGTNVTRNADILATDIQSLKFCYYAQDNTPVCTPACGCNVASVNLTTVHHIGMEITVQSGTQSKTLKTQVYPRNL